MSACRKSLDSASANLELFMFFLSKLWEIQLFFMVLACYQIQHCISKCASFQLFSFIWTSKYDQEDKVLSHIIEYKSRVITLILLGLFQCYTILNENFHVHFKAERKKKKKTHTPNPPPPTLSMNPCKPPSWTFFSLLCIKLHCTLGYKCLPEGWAELRDARLWSSMSFQANYIKLCSSAMTESSLKLFQMSYWVFKNSRIPHSRLTSPKVQNSSKQKILLFYFYFPSKSTDSL